MTSGARFWRNVTIIAGAHLALLIAFVRWGNSAKTTPQQQIVWLAGANTVSAPPPDTEAGGEPARTPEPSETPEEQPSIAPAKSEIQLPTATPTPTATPRPLIKTSPTAQPQSTPRSTPKKSLITKATPKPRPKTTPDEENETDMDAARETIAKVTGGTGGGGTTRSRGSAKPEMQWYGRMLHDRFHNAWDQPTSVVTTGTKMSALVKARIEKDGRVSRFEIVKPSGNIVVDESVRAVAARVTQVDPLPNGVGNGDHYEVTINFELNPEE